MALIDNLVSYWKLDEASGNATDAHGTNTLTDNASVGTGTGKINGARDFESGSSQFFSLADNADLSTGNIDFSFSCWVNLESKAAGMAVLGKYEITNDHREYAIDYEIGADRFRFFVSSDGLGGGSLTTVTANNLGAPATATWYHIVAWHDATNDVIGITVNDGTPDTAATSAGVADRSAAFNIGARDSGAYFDGLIDEVGFWKKVLSSGEITQLYNGASGLAYPFSGGGVTKKSSGLLLVGCG